jgi:two-component system CheB/CheR fusion protein
LPASAIHPAPALSTKIFHVSSKIFVLSNELKTISMKPTVTSHPKKIPPEKKEIENHSFPVVAIGASAGGHEAVTELLENLPSHTSMAYIYIQHLSPNHKSVLAEILTKSTDMKVQEAKDRMWIRPDNFYVIPPDKEMAVMNRHIKLTPRNKGRVVNLPIDTFFGSLAEKYKEGAIGIILSGSASDGTLGLKAIKNEGGLTFAQDASAKYNSMPKSAIAAGAVDFILSPKKIALELARLSHHDYVTGNGHEVKKEHETEKSDSDFSTILRLLYTKTGVDFSHYKLATVKRRIERRMLLCNIKTTKEYAKLLAEKSTETDLLYQDLLIKVTSFFRDTDAHEYLKTVLLPRLLKSKEPGQTLRIWVPACCSGEEAYSIAMMLLEIQSNKTRNIPVQIFATDLSEQAIAKARTGEYSSHDIKSVSPRRLQRFFTRTDGRYRIAKSVRSMCVFASHNLLNSSPYSRIDLISCCNLLIYLDIAAQKKTMAIFHYALSDNGYLMLGKSETIGTSTQLFTNFSNKFKIYLRKKETGLRKTSQLAMRSALPAFNEKIINKPINKNVGVNVNGFDQSIDSVLLSGFMPASVVINHEMEVLQFRGSTSLYLEHASGKASFNILKMARPEVAFELRTAIHKAIKTKQRVRKSGIEIKINSTSRIISLEVVPLKIVWDEPLLLVLFTEPEQVEIYSNDSKAGKNNSVAKDRRIKKLEEELAAARADMYSFAQEQDLAKEELQSASEEVISSNEELQSINEELETSQEEIESANEELITTNQELQMRNELQAETHQYAEAIIATMHEPMVILNKDLLVKSANPSFYKKFGFKEKEIEGMLLLEIGNKQWNIPSLKKLLESIIKKKSQLHNIEITHTFPGTGTKIMRINANRIIQKNHREQLILLAIDDITASATLQLKEKEFFIKDVRDQNAHNAALKKAVRDGTAELQKMNESLGEKNIQLESMNAELASFTFLTSHDLQEPLRKIQICGTAILTKEYQTFSDSG